MLDPHTSIFSGFKTGYQKGEALWVLRLFGETSPGWVYNSGAGLYGLSNWVYHWSLGRGQCTTATATAGLRQ